MYYMRLLNMFNFTVYEGALPNRGFCYAWTEVDGKRWASEIGSGLMKYITNKVPEYVEHLIFYSDTCGGQYRNVHIADLFLNLVQSRNNLQVIEHNFLESGHTCIALTTWRWAACIALSNTAINIFSLSLYSEIDLSVNSYLFYKSRLFREPVFVF